ncbi:hypothetical protein Pelo_8696 [Pelomyxa schiedti]|nr:hypothetical protein Pelo_8696 [Pelomyxa schiedti]
MMKLGAAVGAARRRGVLEMCATGFFVAIMGWSVVVSFTTGMWFPASSFHSEPFQRCPQNDSKCNGFYGFERVLILFLDGFSYNDANKYILPALELSRSHVFHVPNTPQETYAILTTYFSGLPDTNVLGQQVNTDNFFFQMNQCGYNLLVSLHEARRLFGQYIHTDPPPKMFGSLGQPVQNLSEILDVVKSKSQSLFTGSTLLDWASHRWENGKADHTGDVLKNTLKYMRVVKSWIDDNPEYLLVIFSDHGRNTGKSLSHSHGPVADGNEPILVLYSPILQPQRGGNSSSWITPEDVSPIITWYFKCIGIPALSCGRLSPAALPESEQVQFIELSANTEQLLRHLERKSSISAMPYRTEFSEIKARSQNNHTIRDLINLSSAISGKLLQSTFSFWSVCLNLTLALLSLYKIVQHDFGSIAGFLHSLSSQSAPIMSFLIFTFFFPFLLCGFNSAFALQHQAAIIYSATFFLLLILFLSKLHDSNGFYDNKEGLFKEGTRVVLLAFFLLSASIFHLGLPLVLDLLNLWWKRDFAMTNPPPTFFLIFIYLFYLYKQGGPKKTMAFACAPPVIVLALREIVYFSSSPPSGNSIYFFASYIWLLFLLPVAMVFVKDPNSMHIWHLPLCCSMFMMYNGIERTSLLCLQLPIFYLASSTLSRQSHDTSRVLVKPLSLKFSRLTVFSFLVCSAYMFHMLMGHGFDMMAIPVSITGFELLEDINPNLVGLLLCLREWGTFILVTAFITTIPQRTSLPSEYTSNLLQVWRQVTAFVLIAYVWHEIGQALSPRLADFIQIFVVIAFSVVILVALLLYSTPSPLARPKHPLLSE